MYLCTPYVVCTVLDNSYTYTTTDRNMKFSHTEYLNSDFDSRDIESRNIEGLEGFRLEIGASAPNFGFSIASCWLHTLNWFWAKAHSHRVLTNSKAKPAMEAIVGFVKSNLNFQAADVCDDFVDRLHHHITTGLLTLFAIVSSMCVLRLPLHWLDRSTIPCMYCTSIGLRR